jgi:hypothetical protein
LVCPGGLVTRGQMAALLVRYREGLGLPVFDIPPASRDYFTDDDGHVFEAEITDSVGPGSPGGVTRPPIAGSAPINP